MAETKNANDRPINFTTRRSAIFKNANDLVTACGAEVGVLFFSKTGKLFSYGYPSIDGISNRFLEKPTAAAEAVTDCRTCDHITIMNMNHQCDELLEETEALKTCEAVLRRRMEAAKGKKKEPDWWDVLVDDLSLEQLRIAESKIFKISKVLDGCGNISRRSCEAGSAVRDSHRLNLSQGNFSDGSN